MTKKQVQHQNQKWWQSGFAWLVFGGPAIVVVASLTTVYIAVNGQDEVLSVYGNINGSQACHYDNCRAAEHQPCKA